MFIRACTRLLTPFLAAVIVLFAVAANRVSAMPVTWQLAGVTFSDGGTATGTITWDAQLNSLTSWNITVSLGNTALFPALTYDPADSAIFAANSFVVQEDGSTRQIRLFPLNGLTDAGGTTPLDIPNNFSLDAECFNCAPFRTIVAGTLTTTPEPTPTAFLVLTVSATALFRFRRGIPRFRSTPMVSTYSHHQIAKVRGSRC